MLRKKNRRMHMKQLLGSLSSVLPNNSFKLPVNELLDQATTYANKLKERVEEEKGRQELLEAEISSLRGRTILPEVTIRSFESTMEVNLVTGIEKSFMVHEIISILQQEGAEVVSLSYLTKGGRIFCILFSQAYSSRIGIETSRVQERLMNMLYPGI